jgi:hypothetical protein
MKQTWGFERHIDTSASHFKASDSLYFRSIRDTYHFGGESETVEKRKKNLTHDLKGIHDTCSDTHMMRLLELLCFSVSILIRSNIANVNTTFEGPQVRTELMYHNITQLLD